MIIVRWFTRKLMIIIAAFMLGMSNAMNDEESGINSKYIQVEQVEDKAD